ncbi:MAG: hypothetical protein AB7I37_19510 [Pirellulales bacterium]
MDANHQSRNVPYDVEMIRDFFAHLRWNVAALRAQSRRDDGSVPDEVMDAIRELSERRGATFIIPMLRIAEGDYTPAEREQAAQKVIAIRQAQLTLWFDVLDAAQSLVENALDIIETEPDKLPVRVFTPPQVMAWAYGEPDDTWEL